MRIVRLAKRYALLGVALVLAGGAGLLTAVALGTSSAEPTRTVTIDVATGPQGPAGPAGPQGPPGPVGPPRSEEHTSELQSLRHLVCRLLLEKKKKKQKQTPRHITIKQEKNTNREQLQLQ